MKLCALLFVSLVIACGSANASVIVSAGHCSYPLVPGGSLSDIRMDVDLVVSGGFATMTFSNLSGGQETSAVLGAIYVDTVDDDSGAAILWNPIIVGASSGASFGIDYSDGPPGYRDSIADATQMLTLDADSPVTKKGLTLGKWLQVRFATSLASGSTIDDYLASFGGGNDTGEYALGFHAQACSTVDGNSVSGASVPEPTALALIAAGGAGIIHRSRRRA